jgi:hypothetical protein
MGILAPITALVLVQALNDADPSGGRQSLVLDLATLQEIAVDDAREKVVTRAIEEWSTWKGATGEFLELSGDPETFGRKVAREEIVTAWVRARERWVTESEVLVLEMHDRFADGAPNSTGTVALFDSLMARQGMLLGALESYRDSVTTRGFTARMTADRCLAGKRTPDEASWCRARQELDAAHDRFLEFRTSTKLIRRPVRLS